MKKLIIQVRCNEYASREKNPNIPWLPGEIARDAAECRQAGANIMHFHERSKDGSPDGRFETFRDIMLAVRAKTDVMLDPTLGNTTVDGSNKTPEQRLSNVIRLAENPLTKPDFAPVDMGSVNWDLYDPEAREYRTKGIIYKNGTDALEYFLQKLPSLGIKTELISWSIPFTRQITAFLDAGKIRTPACVNFLMSGDSFHAGHPGTPDGLDAHIKSLPKHHHVEWFCGNYQGDLLPITEKIILAGGHIAIGIGDYHYAEYGSPTNAELVYRVAKQAQALGREVATLEETRHILGMGSTFIK